MNAFKLSAVALALAASFSASAMTPLQEADLSQVAGQEGVSIIADLNINIGAFTYTDDGASVSFNNIGINGLIVTTIDVLTSTAFQSSAASNIGLQLMRSTGDASFAAMLVGATATATGYVAGTDVVRLAFPSAFGELSPSIVVSSITTGHGGASMGGIQLNRIDLGGTTVYMYGH